MKLKLSAIASLALAFGLGYASATLYHRSSLEASAVEPRLPVRGAELLAQGDYGYRCATVNGICPLDVPQPIGSTCECPEGTKGTTIR